MRVFKLLILTILLVSCYTKRNGNLNSAEFAVNKNLSQNEIDSIERESYYGYDSLDLGEYLSNFGHLIQLQGSKSGNFYRIKVKTKDLKSIDGVWVINNPIYDTYGKESTDIKIDRIEIIQRKQNSFRYAL